MRTEGGGGGGSGSSRLGASGRGPWGVPSPVLPRDAAVLGTAGADVNWESAASGCPSSYTW